MNSPVLPALMSLGARALLAIALLVLVATISDHPRPTPAASPVTEPTAEPSGYGLAKPTGVPASVPATYSTSSGSLAYADPAFGRWYLALPDPRGTRAVICGPADCVPRTSTDYGPDQREHPERIADLSAVDFERVCGMTAAQRVVLGRCPGTVTILERPHGTLPPTDQ